MTPETSVLFRKKNLSWYSWNFGIELLLVNASIYFSEWLVVGNKVPDFWYSFTFIISTIALIFISPYLGVALDRKGRRLKTFVWMTALTLLSGILIEAFAGLHSFYPRVILTLLAFLFLNLLYQLAGLVANTFLKDISTRFNAGKVVGIMQGMTTLGDTIGLLITLPIILGMVMFLGTSEISVLIPSAIIGSLFCIPMFLAFRKQADPPVETYEEHGTYKQIWHDLKDTERYPGVTRLLFAFYLYNDAILTLQLFAAIYLQKVYGIPDSHKVLIIMTVYLTSVFGAWFGGYFGDKFGNKNVLLCGILLTAVTVGVISFGNPGLILYILFGLFGFGNGISFTCTKALFSNLIPYEKKAQFFGMYSISEKFASIIGPAAWGIIVYFVSARNGLNYRVAVLAMSLFLLIGAFIMRKVKDIRTAAI